MGHQLGCFYLRWPAIEIIHCGALGMMMLTKVRTLPITPRATGPVIMARTTRTALTSWTTWLIILASHQACLVPEMALMELLTIPGPPETPRPPEQMINHFGIPTSFPRTKHYVLNRLETHGCVDCWRSRTWILVKALYRSLVKFLQWPGIGIDQRKD